MNSLSDVNNRLSVTTASNEIIDVSIPASHRTYASASNGRTYVPIRDGRLYLDSQQHNSVQGAAPPGDRHSTPVNTGLHVAVSSFHNNSNLSKTALSRDVLRKRHSPKPTLPGGRYPITVSSANIVAAKKARLNVPTGTDTRASWTSLDRSPSITSRENSAYSDDKDSRRDSDSDYAIPYSGHDAEFPPESFTMPKYMRNRPNSVFFRNKRNQHAGVRPKSDFSHNQSNLMCAASTSSVTQAELPQETTPSSSAETASLAREQKELPEKIDKPTPATRSQSRLLLDGSGYAAAFYEANSSKARLRETKIVNRPHSACILDVSSLESETTASEILSHPRSRTADDLPIPAEVSESSRRLSPRSRYLTMKKLEQGWSFIYRCI